MSELLFSFTFVCCICSFHFSPFHFPLLISTFTFHFHFSLSLFTFTFHFLFSLRAWRRNSRAKCLTFCSLLFLFALYHVHFHFFSLSLFTAGIEEKQSCICLSFCSLFTFFALYHIHSVREQPYQFKDLKIKRRLGKHQLFATDLIEVTTEFSRIQDCHDI